MHSLFTIVLFLGIQDGSAVVSSDDIDALLVDIQKAQRECGPIALWYTMKRLGVNADLKKTINQCTIEERGVRID